MVLEREKNDHSVDPKKMTRVSEVGGRWRVKTYSSRQNELEQLCSECSYISVTSGAPQLVIFIPLLLKVDSFT